MALFAMRHLSKPWREVLAFFLHYDIALWSPGTLRVYVSTLGWTQVEISSHEGSLFQCRHLQRTPETQMLRLACQRITNQTKEALLLSPVSGRTSISIGHVSQSFIKKCPSWNLLLSTQQEHPPAEICFFLGHLTKETWRISKTQGKVKEHPWVGWISKATESHSLSGAPGCCLCKGRPTWRGARSWDHRQQVFQAGIRDPP